jgi:hypothetical protein
LDITSEANAEETRARYLADREERHAESVVEAEPVEEESEPAGEGVDPELIRKLEEFRRTMFAPQSGDET